MKNVLGISAFYHDSAAALATDGKIIAAAQEERFTRKKHTPGFSIHAIKYCLDETGLEINELDAIVFYDKPLLKFERLLAFFPSPYKKAVILTIDGVGEWCTASIGQGDGNKISILKEMDFPHSVGLLYSAFTYYLGFTVNSGEYKLMGLAPYGNTHSSQTIKFIETIKEKLVDIKEDGSI